MKIFSFYLCAYLITISQSASILPKLSEIPVELVPEITRYLDAKSVAAWKSADKDALKKVEYLESYHLPELIDLEAIGPILQFRRIKDQGLKLDVIFKLLDRAMNQETALKTAESLLLSLEISKDMEFQQKLKSHLERMKFPKDQPSLSQLILDRLVVPYLERNNNKYLWRSLLNKAVDQDLPNVFEVLLFNPILKSIYEKQTSLGYANILETTAIKALTNRRDGILYRIILGSLEKDDKTELEEEEGSSGSEIDDAVTINEDFKLHLKHLHRNSVSSVMSDASTLCMPICTLGMIDPAFDKNKLLRLAVTLHYIDMVRFLLAFPTVQSDASLGSIYSQALKSQNMESASAISPFVDPNDEDLVYDLVRSGNKKAMRLVFYNQHFDALPREICDAILGDPEDEDESFQDIRNRLFRLGFDE